MGVPLNLKDIQSGFLTASAHTANNTLIEQALNKALDRTGSSDNAMEVDLDMGLNRITNVGAAINSNDVVSKGQAESILVASGDQITSTAERDNFIATAGQSLFTLSNIEYITGTNSLIVFVNGVYQLVGTDYTETSTTSITFNEGLANGDVVVVIGARFNAEVFVTESSSFADAAETSATEAAASAADAEASATDAETAQTQAEAAAGYKLGINNQSGTTYTLVASDEGDLVRMTNASANTVTVPPNSSVAFEVGTVVNVRQAGAGTTTIAPGSGVTINAPNDEFDTDGEEFGIALVKVGTDEWDLVKSYAGVRNDQFDNSITAAAAESGYQKLPSGLILQWGTSPVGAGDLAPISFPIPFPNAAINVTATPYLGGVGGDNDAIAQVRSFTNSSVTLVINAASSSFFSTRANWFAIGA